MVISIIHLLPLLAKTNKEAKNQLVLCHRSSYLWWRFVCRIFIGECSQDQYLLESERGKIGQEETYLFLGWSHGECWSWEDPEELSLTGARGLGLIPLALTSQWIRLLPGRDHHIEQDGFLQLKGTSAASCQSSTVSDPGEMCALVLRKGDVDSIPQSPPYSASKKSKWDSRFPSQNSGT